MVVTINYFDGGDDEGDVLIVMVIGAMMGPAYPLLKPIHVSSLPPLAFASLSCVRKG